MNRSARIMSTSSPGEISISEETRNQLSIELLDQCIVYSRGAFSLKGLKGKIPIYTITHKSLAERKSVFEKYRADNALASSALDSSVTSSSCMSPNNANLETADVEEFETATVPWDRRAHQPSTSPHPAPVL